MSESNLHIVFIDDEQYVLDGLRRGMGRMRSEWDMSFAAGGEAAKIIMQQRAPDVVVSDMRMPRISGRELLQEVRTSYPHAVRLILSGYADPLSIMQVAGVAHQYLSKPCNCADLKAAIARSYALRRMLNDPALIAYIGKIDTLPTLPEPYRQIRLSLQAAEPDMSQIVDIVRRDVVMTSVILKLANSAFFGAKQAFKSADRAVRFLGLDTISGLILSHNLFTEFKGAVQSPMHLDELWRHSLKTASIARALARHEGWSAERADEAFLAGMLHDLGKLVLALSPPPPPASWRSISGTTCWDSGHEVVGAFLLGLWGFSDALLEAIAFQHVPSRAAQAIPNLAGILHIADQLSYFPYSGDSSPVPRQFEPGYLESTGLAGRLKDWEQIVELASL